jgi:hypothetical protein
MQIRLFRRNDLIIVFTVEDPQGEPFDLTGASAIDFVVRWNNDEFIRKTLQDGVDILDAKNGEVQVHLVASDTDISAGAYRFELIIIDGFGQRLVADQDDFVVQQSLTFADSNS